MFGILLSLSYIAILSLQPRVDAFLVQNSFPSITNPNRCRDPRMTPIVSQPELRHLQPSFAKPIGTVTDGVQSSLGKVCSTVFSLLLPFREATVPLVALAMSNEWQVNLVKHVLTLISIRFVFSTIVDYQRQTSFQWRKVPRYLLASGLIALGGYWIDSLGVIPYYGINLLKHVATMYVCTQAVRFVYSRRKSSEPSSLKTDRKAVESQSVVIPKKSPPPPPVTKPPAPAPPLPSPAPPQTAVKEKVVAVAVTEKVDKLFAKKEKSTPVTQETPSVEEQPKDDQAALEDKEKETDESNKDSEKKENTIDDSLNEWFYSLANIQDELAEIQLKVIPEIFSKEAYDRTQERITKFQMEKIMKFFADDD